MLESKLEEAGMVTVGTISGMAALWDVQEVTDIISKHMESRVASLRIRIS